MISRSIVTRLSAWQSKNLGSIPTAGKRLFMDWLPLKVTETIFFIMSEWLTNDMLSNPKRLWNIFSLHWSALFVKPAIHLHLLVSLKVHGALTTLCHTSLCIMFKCYVTFFTNSINRVPIHIISMHLLGQILRKIK